MFLFRKIQDIQYILTNHNIFEHDYLTEYFTQGYKIIINLKFVP